VSLIQIEVQHGYARCAVDTRITGAQVPDLPTPEASKMFAIPHAGCLAAARGGIVAFAFVSAVLMGPRTHDFDSIVENLSETVSQISQGFPASGCEPVLQFFVIGWSNASHRMDVAGFEIDLRNNRCERTPVEQRLIGPPLPLDCRYGFHGLATDDAMHEVARLQLQSMTEIDPQGVTGGRLLVAEVTRHEIRIHDAGPIREIANLEDG